MTFNLMTLLPGLLAVLGRGRATSMPTEIEERVKDAIDLISVLPRAELETPIVPIDIAAAQSKLAQLGFEPGPVDGWPGMLTQAAVKAYQRTQGLAVDGLIGQKTWAALMGASQK